jgi:CRP-like cAMP-binding protein
MNDPGRIDRQPPPVPLFQGLSKRQRGTVSSLGTRIDAEAGKVLAREGQPGGEFILVREGSVEVRVGDRVVATRGPGDYVGETALLCAGPRSATVVAQTQVIILVLSRREFWSLLDAVPELSDHLRATMNERMIELETSELPDPFSESLEHAITV